MVRLAGVKSTNATFCSSRPLVLVFVAASGGIGALTLRQLAISHSRSQENLRVYLVARDAKASEAIIAECRQVCPKADFRYVKVGDASLLKDVDKCCTNIKTSESRFGASGRLDGLFMFQGVALSGERSETKEGIDKAMSLVYYSRMRFIINLLPLLLQAQLPAHVVSVYAAGAETWGTLHADDLSLRKPGNYSFSASRTNVVHMKTVAFEKLAKEYPGRLSLTHLYPWIVIHQGFYSDSHPLWFRIIWRFVAPLMKLVALSHEEIGQRVLFCASSARYPARSLKTADRDNSSLETIATSTDEVIGGGAYSVNYDNEVRDVSRNYTRLREEGFPERVWNHTMQVFASVDAGEQFTG